MENNYKNPILFLLVSAFFITSAECCIDGTKNKIFIDNGRISLGFSSNTGAFTNFTDCATNYEILDDHIRDGSPWEIEFRTPEGSRFVDIYSAGKFSYSNPEPGIFVLKWGGFPEPEAKMEVISTISLEPERSISYWSISVNNLGKNKIFQLIFPRISGIKETSHEFLAVPQWMGQIMENPRAHLALVQNRQKSYSWTYPGLSLQCLALYDPDKYGFYAACNDTAVYNKDFSISLDSTGSLVYKMHNFPSQIKGMTSYSTEYKAVIGSFKGDWLTAAGIYREWGSKQRWATESRLSKRLTPEWLEKTALWIWNRGRSENVLLPAEDLRERLALPVSVFWHWWHGCSYDDGFPEYTPPREGKESFIHAVNKAGEKGMRAIVYMNQRLWGTTTESWEKERASDYAVKDPDGKVNTHIYNIFTQKPAASMCLATFFWKNKYASLCDSVVNGYKVGGVYMDQACLTMACYDSTHGHPVGSGNYWFRNFCRLSESIRSRVAAEKQLVLAGEGSGEAWMPYLDLFLTLAVSRERYAGIDGWETIPFFQAIYHQNAITYGNYSSLLIPPYDELWPEIYAPEQPMELLSSKFNRQFLMEQARSFVWGLQPTIANYQKFLSSERKEEIEYLLNLAMVRNQGLKYLLYGKFVRSPEINAPEILFDISRLSIYAGKEGKTITEFQKKFPVLYTGTWQAPDNNVGIAIASISDDPVKIKFDITAQEYDLPPNGKINIIDRQGKRNISSYSEGMIRIEQLIKSKELLIIEIEADKR